MEVKIFHASYLLNKFSIIFLIPPGYNIGNKARYLFHFLTSLSFLKNPGTVWSTEPGFFVFILISQQDFYCYLLFILQEFPGQERLFRRLSVHTNLTDACFPAFGIADGHTDPGATAKPLGVVRSTRMV